jgi:hypothetical protein
MSFFSVAAACHFHWMGLRIIATIASCMVEPILSLFRVLTDPPALRPDAARDEQVVCRERRHGAEHQLGRRGCEARRRHPAQGPRDEEVVRPRQVRRAGGGRPRSSVEAARCTVLRPLHRSMQACRRGAAYADCLAFCRREDDWARPSREGFEEKASACRCPCTPGEGSDTVSDDGVDTPAVAGAGRGSSHRQPGVVGRARVVRRQVCSVDSAKMRPCHPPPPRRRPGPRHKSQPQSRRTPVGSWRSRHGVTSPAWRRGKADHRRACRVPKRPTDSDRP